VKRNQEQWTILVQRIHTQITNVTEFANTLPDTDGVRKAINEYYRSVSLKYSRISDLSCLQEAQPYNQADGIFIYSKCYLEKRFNCSC
jgi:hypothetical protein